MNLRKKIILSTFLILLSSGCATHELVLSRTLKPALSAQAVDFPVTHFHARVQMGRLEVWARVRRSDSDYQANFDCEIESTAALCAALAESELTFKNDWYKLVLELTHEYGSQWRWRNTVGYTKVEISRETLLDLGRRKLPVPEYPRYWKMFAYKVGPPDYKTYEWSTAPAENNSAE